MELNKVYCGKMEDVLVDFTEDAIDSIVTDPPYGLNFMGKKWDYDVPSVTQWKEAYRVLKPGGYMLVACGTRTQHRMVVNIEDAGFEIRDVITWHYGSGFPKSLDISKQIDKKAGAEREIIDKNKAGSTSKAFHLREQYDGTNLFLTGGEYDITEPATDAAKEWEGWGTALKPATEFWTLCRKPISENTVAENVLKHGTGGINIDACRIGCEDGRPLREVYELRKDVEYSGNSLMGRKDGSLQSSKAMGETTKGRFPANLILDEFMAAELDKQSGILTSGNVSPEGFKGEYTGTIYGKFKNNQIPSGSLYGDSGGASRFFYVAKPSPEERNKGLRMSNAKFMDESRKEGSIGGSNPRNRGAEFKRNNFHPTVKPIELMRYLVKMITPKGGTCLDSFCGSGSTLIACKLEEINYIGIDKEQEYCEMAEARIKAWPLQKDLFNL